MNSTPEIPDARLIEAHDLALAALREITPEASIGAPAGYAVEEGGVVSLRFANRLAGYPGWFWTVSLARVEDAEPTVLEVELLPGDGALLAPEWVPWAERLADYQAQQAVLAQAGVEVADDEDPDELDDEDLEDDFEEASLLHSGDVDGVEIDELDEDADDEDLDDPGADEIELGGDPANDEGPADDPEGEGEAFDADVADDADEDQRFSTT